MADGAESKVESAVKNPGVWIVAAAASVVVTGIMIRMKWLSPAANTPTFMIPTS